MKPIVMKKLLPSLALGLLLLVRPLGAEISPLTQAIMQAAAELPAGGFVLAEVADGNTTYAAAGRPIARKDLPPEAIIFEIGSITKVFTGLLLAQAVLDGKTGLDDPIAKHLPADLTLDPSVAAITLAQLASHTSGLPRLPDNLNPTNPADPYANYGTEQLHDFLRRHRLEAPAPQPAAYSNLGTGLLGHLLAGIYGMTYAELVAAKITRPLGLDDTVITLNPEQESRFAIPHSGSTAVLPWSLNVLAGAGALRSTAADLAYFAQELMNPESPLAEAFALARQPVAPFGGRSRIGLGFMIANRNGQDVYYHGGGTGGFRSVLELIPATGKATVLLLNNDALEPAAIVSAANRPQPAGANPAGREEAAIGPEELRAFTGVFAIDAQGRFTAVVDADGRLRIRLTGQPFLPVFYAGKDRFFARAVAAEFQFSRDEAGAITGLTLHQNGNEVAARRTGDAPAVLFPKAEELAPYVGRYELAPGLIFDVTARGAQLLAKLTGQPTFPVFNIAPDRFVYDVVEAALTFERDERGGVTAVTLHQGGRDMRAPRLGE
ncbi:MAG: serine hydrolase [Opitutaceae bacterium]|nr:serine hydrolase [Opitutaceae bacterium]